MAALLDWLQFLAGLCAAGNLQLEYGAVPGCPFTGSMHPYML